MQHNNQSAINQASNTDTPYMYDTYADIYEPVAKNTHQEQQLHIIHHMQ